MGQTIAVLRQSWMDGLRPILVINKIDRLVTELKLEPVEAYNHLSRLVEQVNAVMGSFFAGERMEDDLRWREQREHQQKTDAGLNDGENDDALDESYQEKDDEDIYFAPQRGNVIFASAIDNWGFRIGRFAQIYAAKMGVKEANLRRVLWGDYYLDPKTKTVIGHKHLRGRALKPLFVQFVLDNIWAIYDAVIINPYVFILVLITSALIPLQGIPTKSPKL
jgi:ribosome assembly protein 1